MKEPSHFDRLLQMLDPALEDLRDLSDPSPMLSSLAEDLVNYLRGNRENPRVSLFEDFAVDIYTDEGLTSLHSDLNSELTPIKTEAPCTEIAAALIAVHSARFDWNWTGMKVALSWIETALGKGYSKETYLALQVAAVSVEFGTARAGLRQVPRIEDIRGLSEQISAEEAKSTDQTNSLPRLKFWLAESVSTMSSLWLSEDSSEPYRELALDLSESDRYESVGQLSARFALVQSEMWYAAKDLDKAQRAILRALNVTSGVDPAFIERCQTQLEFLEQEQASREANQERIVGETRKRVNKHTSVAVKKVQDEMTSEFKERSREMEDELRKQLTRELNSLKGKVQEEIRAALFRVVEILGLFMAIVSVAVTTVGGITVGEGIGQTLVIFGTGYGAIVTLFVVLRWIVPRAESVSSIRQSKC